MKLTELMIGNIVRWKYGEDEYNTVHSIDPEQIDLQIITPFGVSPEDIEGVLLTEEWILKFHPNALDLSNQIFRVGRFKLMWKFAYNYWYIVDDITGCYMTKLDFVHEWQNFWHIMNGEELTIKQT